MDTLPTTSAPLLAQTNTRLWTVLCHASSFLGFVIPVAGHFAGPLLIWLLKRNESPEVDEHGKESLNFQISMFIYLAALGVVAFILMFVLIGFLLFPVIAILYVAGIVLVIIASLKAGEGQFYRYPLTIRLIK
ncbi:MAG: DUF4870 domain-containing protein [Verrucomicrobiota bacterium]|nr:DUF4870 domain-containing protein [Verrucomicrobiota bacterium]